jgi:CheY-like chemotaxis protein
MTAQPPVLIVVDDEPGILEVVERLARRTGYEVVACAGGMQALSELSTRHADIALVDLRMPALPPSRARSKRSSWAHPTISASPWISHAWNGC